MAKRKQYDWEAIEREYRAGQLSIRELARQHGCSAPAITQKAKRKGWTRDLTAEVRKRVNTKLVNVNVNTQAASDEEIVEAAADVGFQVANLHRRDIAKYRELSNKLMAELDDQGGTALLERIKGAALLAGTLKNLITLERQAFNLDDSNPEDKETTLKIIYDKGHAPNADD